MKDLDEIKDTADYNSIVRLSMNNIADKGQDSV